MDGFYDQTNLVAFLKTTLLDGFGGKNESHLPATTNKSAGRLPARYAYTAYVVRTEGGVRVARRLLIGSAALAVLLLLPFALRAAYSDFLGF